MIATELLRHEFFTIFGGLDTRHMQHGKGFEAKVFRQVCQMLINAIGAAQHSPAGRAGKAWMVLGEVLGHLQVSHAGVDVPFCAIRSPGAAPKGLGTSVHLAQHQNPGVGPPDTSQENDKRTGANPVLGLFCLF